MTERLPLESTKQRSYALDAASREAGRRGLAKAREALADARARHHVESTASDDHPVAA